MSNRYLESSIQKLCFTTNKMAFVSGPRQCGKTTMAKSLLQERGNGVYCNWDELNFRRTWAQNPSQIITTLQTIQGKKPLVILDEIHKAKLWKRTIKGLYDTLTTPCDILVTGSARLNIYRKGSDSLLGRYYHMRLHPFSLAEMLGNKNIDKDPAQLLETLFNNSKHDKKATEFLMSLDKFGPFPEPLFANSTQILNLWRRGRIEKIIREDLRDISRLPELSQIEMLVALMGDRVANPLSIQTLSEDLEVAYTTVKRWLLYLQELYYCFTIKPHYKSLARALKKTSKLYLWDFGEIHDEAKRFENLIAYHLLKYCDYLTDVGHGNFELKYLRDKEHHEIDFLLLWNNRPWFMVEVKLNHTKNSPNWSSMMQKLPCKYAVQVVKKPNIYSKSSYPYGDILLISADQFLTHLV